MKKFSSSLCLVVTVLLLACSQDGEALAPLPPGSINAADRREFKKSEVTEQFNLDPFHATLEEFKNGGFNFENVSNVFCPHYAGAISKHKNTGYFGYCS